MWQPTINPISAAAAAATSAALAERASSVVAIAGMVRDLVLVSVGLVIYLHVTGDYYLLIFNYMSISCQNGDTRNLGDVKPRISEESNDKSKIWKLTEINEQSQCRSLKLPENVRVTKVCYLLQMYCISSHRNFINEL